MSDTILPATTDDNLLNVLAHHAWQDWPSFTFDQWQQVGEQLAQAKATAEWAVDMTNWALGNWIEYGDAKWGEKYAQAVDVTGLRESTLQRLAYTVRQFGGRPSHPALPFTYHAEVAFLPEPEREAILDQAQEQGLTRARIRQLVQQRKFLRDGKPDDSEIRFVLTQALQDLRQLPPEHWGRLIVWALKPLLKAPGLRDELLTRLQEEA